MTETWTRFECQTEEEFNNVVERTRQEVTTEFEQCTCQAPQPEPEAVVAVFNTKETQVRAAVFVCQRCGCPTQVKEF